MESLDVLLPYWVGGLLPHIEALQLGVDDLEDEFALLILELFNIAQNREKRGAGVFRIFFQAVLVRLRTDW